MQVGSRLINSKESGPSCTWSNSKSAIERWANGLRNLSMAWNIRKITCKFHLDITKSSFDPSSSCYTYPPNCPTLAIGFMHVHGTHHFMNDFLIIYPSPHLVDNALLITEVHVRRVHGAVETAFCVIRFILQLKLYHIACDRDLVFLSMLPYF